MTDSTETPDDESTVDPGTNTSVATTTATADADAATAKPEEAPKAGKRNVLTYLQWAGLGLCVVLVLVAGLRVYWGVGAFISLWVASKYEPIVTAGFNLAVLLLAAYGVTILSRRLTATS